MELDRHVARPLDLEDARGPIPVEGQLRVRVVIHQEDVEFPAPLDDALEILARRDRRCRVVRVVEIEQLGTEEHIGRHLVELQQEARARTKRVAIRRSFGEERAAEVGEVARLRDDAVVAVLEVAEREQRDPLLGADEGDDLGEGIEGLAEALRHPTGDRFAKRGQSQTEAVAAHLRIARRAGERVDGGRRRRQVGVPGAQVDHVHSPRHELALSRRDGGERVLGERLESRGELRHQGSG